MTRFEGKVVVMTGAARPPGMGWSAAVRMAREGASLVCVDRVAGAGPGTDAATPEAFESLRRQLRDEGAPAISIDADVTDPSVAADVFDRAVAEFGGVDVCCCLTGTSGDGAGSGDLAALSDSSWRRCIDVNLSAPYFVARAAIPHLTTRGGGAITLMSSYAGLNPSPTAGAIGTARAGLNFLVAALATELGPQGIRVNAVCPLGVGSSAGALATSGLDGLIANSGDFASRDDWAQSAIPLGRLQTADETAALVAFLSSDDASFISGQAVSVAGGAFG